jgi:para-aminobenzoate synthetase
MSAHSRVLRTLLIDNYDSYSHNLLELITRATGSEPLVVKNDEIESAEALSLPIDCIVMSPGPGTPDTPRDIGIGAQLLRMSGIPVLGVCLGHQLIAREAGARVAPARCPAHGIVSTVSTRDDPLFAQLPRRIEVVRYHSLEVVRPLPDGLTEIATAEDGTIMAVRSTSRPHWGVQFHPEAVCTQHGEQLIRNFHSIAGRRLSPPTPHGRPGRAASAPEPRTEERGHGRTRLHLARREVVCAAEPRAVYEELYLGRPGSFWLDTSSVRPTHRWSYMGVAEGSPDHLITTSGNVVTTTTADGTTETRLADSGWTHFRERLEAYCIEGETQSPFKGGYVGYLGYGLQMPTTSAARQAEDGPDLAMIFCTRFLAIDHAAGRFFAHALHAEGDQESAHHWLERIAETLAALPAKSAKSPRRESADPDLLARALVETASDTREEYEDKVRACREKIRQGEAYEICLTTGFAGPALADPFAVYRELRSVNPAPYSAYLDFGSFQVLSSSPERFLRVAPDGRVETKPIKGTSPREADPEADRCAAERMAADAKMRAENMMIVDLLRNDLNRVCRVGTVCVDSLMHVESYQTVHQLVSTISGCLGAGRTSADAVESCFPGGSMTGAPKLRTMEIISDLEERPRGAYAGALGMFSLDGYADLSILIRAVVNDSRRWFIGAGGAVLINSDPAEEYLEMIEKASPPLAAVLLAGQSAKSDV